MDISTETKQDENLIQRKEKEFQANMTAAINMAKTAKAVYKAGMTEDAVMNAEDAGTYAMRGYEALYHLHVLRLGVDPEHDGSEAAADDE